MSFYWNKCYKYTQKSDNIKAIYKVGKKFIYKLDCILGRLKLIKTNKKKEYLLQKRFKFCIFTRNTLHLWFSRTNWTK